MRYFDLELKSRLGLSDEVSHILQQHAVKLSTVESLIEKGILPDEIALYTLEHGVLGVEIIDEIANGLAQRHVRPQVASDVARLAAAQNRIDSVRTALDGINELDSVLEQMLGRTAKMSGAEGGSRVVNLLSVARHLPLIPESYEMGTFFAQGGTSKLYEMASHPHFLIKLGGGRLPREATAMIEMEMLTIPTVYAGTRQRGGQTNIIVKRIDGVGSKDIIGRLRQPKNPPEHAEVVTQRTIDDLRRIYAILKENRANVGDFQFIVRQADGAVFVNDPVSFHRGRGPSGNIQNIIERFESILRRKQQTQKEGVDK